MAGPVPSRQSHFISFTAKAEKENKYLWEVQGINKQGGSGGSGLPVHQSKQSVLWEGRAAVVYRCTLSKQSAPRSS
jgi:hypothetical protein